MQLSIAAAAKLSVFAYYSREGAVNAARDEGWDAEFIEDAETGTQALLLCCPGLQVIAFRGTEPTCARDWLTDLRAAPLKIDDIGLAHQGFLDAFLSVNDRLFARLDRNVPIALTGHSLGGALALIAAAFLRRKGYAVQKVVTFGAPRAGNKDFVRYLRPVEIIRVHRAFDMVPRLPPAGPMLGYRHAGWPLYIGADGETWRSADWWTRLTNTAAMLKAYRGPVRAAVAAHDKNAYANLTRLAERR